MSDRLEDFVQNNREDFDKFEPGPVVWNNIHQQLKKPAEKKGILISMNVLRWSAAAAILLVVGSAAFYAITKKDTVMPATVAQTAKPQSNDLPVLQDKDRNKDSAVKEEFNAPKKVSNDAQLAQVDDADFKEELVHYTRLVELKQNQIKRITKDEPLLYQQFAGDFNKLDSTFHILKKQLPVNPNREQILEAMIQNLQYQEALLNQQLNILKKIDNTKKQAYEKAYRSA